MTSNFDNACNQTHSISISFNGLSEEQIKSFTSILFFAEPQLNYRWSIQASGSRQVTLIDNPALIDSIVGPVICYSQLTHNADTEDRRPDLWYLAIDDRQVPSLRGLGETLNQVGDYLAQQNTPEPLDTTDPQKTKDPIATPETSLVTLDQPEPADNKTLESVTPTPTSRHHVPRDELLGYLDSPAASAEEWHFGPDASVFIDYQKGRYYARLRNDELAKQLISRQAIEVEPFNPLNVELRASELGASVKPLSHLKWIVALSTPATEYLAQLQNTVVSLIKWPDLTLLVNRKCIRLATLMQTQQLSITELAVREQLEPSKVAAFVRACDELGILKKHP